MDGNSMFCKYLIQAKHQPADSPPHDWIPAVHTGMTGFIHLCIRMSGERGNDQIGLSGNGKIIARLFSLIFDADAAILLSCDSAVDSRMLRSDDRRSQTARGKASLASQSKPFGFAQDRL